MGGCQRGRATAVPRGGAAIEGVGTARYRTRASTEASLSDLGPWCVREGRFERGRRGWAHCSGHRVSRVSSVAPAGAPRGHRGARRASAPATARPLRSADLYKVGGGCHRRRPPRRAHARARGSDVFLRPQFTTYQTSARSHHAAAWSAPPTCTAARGRARSGRGGGRGPVVRGVRFGAHVRHRGVVAGWGRVVAGSGRVLRLESLDATTAARVVWAGRGRARARRPRVTGSPCSFPACDRWGARQTTRRR